MTYYRDLSKYTYSDSTIPDLNIGWLSRFRTFAEGDVDAEVMAILAFQARMPRNQMRGRHPCYFCSILQAKGAVIPVEIFGVGHRLGSAEIHAFSRSGDVFSAPDLIYHYIGSHGYRPPSEFMEALMDGNEGKINDSVIHRLRELVENAPRMEDRVDAAIDLIQIAPMSSVEWLRKLIARSICHPYLKRQVEAALQLL
ncbi:hypothetical protein [Streptomyces sp. NPDC091416]|uniref:DUF7919 family protein n=1 Tax=Streptomyces sp. NPDC091416 TaxID=3366003 RepID=UPI0037F70DBA